MVIQNTADSGQIPVQLLTGFTLFLLAAITLLLGKMKPVGDNEEAQE
jgi:hypothetical protein